MQEPTRKYDRERVRSMPPFMHYSKQFMDAPFHAHGAADMWILCGLTTSQIFVLNKKIESFHHGVLLLAFIVIEGYVP